MGLERGWGVWVALGVFGGAWRDGWGHSRDAKPPLRGIQEPGLAPTCPVIRPGAVIGTGLVAQPFKTPPPQISSSPHPPGEVLSVGVLLVPRSQLLPGLCCCHGLMQGSLSGKEAAVDVSCAFLPVLICPRTGPRLSLPEVQNRTAFPAS